MPPYAVLKVQPRRFNLPGVQDGMNVRTEVVMGQD